MDGTEIANDGTMLAATENAIAAANKELTHIERASNSSTSSPLSRSSSSPSDSPSSSDRTFAPSKSPSSSGEFVCSVKNLGLDQKTWYNQFTETDDTDNIKWSKQGPQSKYYQHGI